jgi:hypothetical protein
MRIETAKNNQVDKKDTTNNFKTEKSLFDTTNQLKTAESVPAQTTGAFAKILDEARKQGDKDKDNSPTSKSDTPEKNSKSSKSESDEKVNRQADEKKELEERNSKNGDSDARQNDDDSQASALALAAMQPETKIVSEISAPAARSILHIADLERIVSSIRTQTFQNEKQVTIALKNSIMEGLQIKLTINENGKIKAEFLALNEQIKKQLNARKKELSDILSNRSALFSEVEVKSQNEGQKE